MIDRSDQAFIELLSDILGVPRPPIQYRQIMDVVREMKKHMTPAKVVRTYNGWGGTKCPECTAPVSGNCCSECGKPLDWSKL